MARLLFPLLLGLFLFTAACSSTAPEANVAAAAKSKPSNAAADFSLKDAGGRTVKLSDYKGKVVLLNFWATWCAPCRIEIPWFMDFENKYKDRGFAVIGVSLDEDGWEAVKPYIAERRINYRILLGNEEVSQKYGGLESLPTTFLIDREGRIVSRHVGLVSKKDYEDEIVQILGRSRAAYSDQLRAARRAD